MQKKLIALAIAGLSGAAFAQSNVTIYGVMDATYDNVSATGSTAANASLPNRGRTTFNSSYIGFKGSEDLGGGLKAVFQIETGLSEQAATTSVGAIGGAIQNSTSTLGTGAAGWANRDTYVGLAGNWGTLVAGNLTGPTRVVGAVMDVNAGATGIGANTALLGKLGGGSGAGLFDQRIANAIAYISPTWSGFHFAVGYLPNENRGTDAVAQNTVTNTSGWTLGGVYDNGPIFGALTWTQVKDANANSGGSAYQAATVLAAATPIIKASNTRAAFKYNFGNGTVGIMWDSTKADAAVGGNAVDVKQNVWYLPVTFNVTGNGKIIAQYGRANNLSGSALAATGNAGKDYTSKHFELGYVHSMSKRTEARVVWSQITNSTDAQNDFLYGVSAPNSTAYGARNLAAGADPRGLSVGIRHSF